MKGGQITREFKLWRPLSRVFVWAVLALVVFVPLQAESAINKQLQFSGKLTKSDKTNVTNGAYGFKFEIFSVASGGSALWTETWNGSSSKITVTDGLFSIALGTYTDLSVVDFNSSSLYLAISFDPGNDGTYEELFTTRIRLTSSPYSLNSDKLDGKDESEFADLSEAETISNDWLFGEDIRFGDADNSNYIGFQAPANISTNVIWTLPSVDGTVNQVLKTDGNGTLSWADSSSGTIY